MGIVMTLAALGTALGPTIGGVLTQYFSWHAIFFINVPVGIVAVLLGAKVIPSDGERKVLTGFDSTGAGLIFVGLASFLFVVSEGDSLGWTSPAILILGALALFTLGWFVRHELNAADPILDLRLFKNRNFFLTNLLLCLVFFSFAGINYLLPFYLKYVRGIDTSNAGLIMTALSFAMMGAGILSGMLFNRTGPRALCVASRHRTDRRILHDDPAPRRHPHRLCGPQPGADRLWPRTHDHAGLQHGHELGGKDKAGDGLEPDRPGTVRPADAWESPSSTWSSSRALQRSLQITMSREHPPWRCSSRCSRQDSTLRSSSRSWSES